MNASTSKFISSLTQKLKEKSEEATTSARNIADLQAQLSRERADREDDVKYVSGKLSDALHRITQLEESGTEGQRKTKLSDDATIMALRNMLDRVCDPQPQGSGDRYPCSESSLTVTYPNMVQFRANLLA